MAEEYTEVQARMGDIEIKLCTEGFLVRGGEYGGDELRAFSTAESLIEWLSTALGAGPIVWGLTLEVWREKAGIDPDDLLPVPDPSVDRQGYREAIEGNALFLLNHFVEKELKKRTTVAPAKPKPKKSKKPKGEKPKK